VKNNLQSTDPRDSIPSACLEKLKILHVLGQRPEMTGSGIYLEALIKESDAFGFANYRIAGVPAGGVPAEANDATANSSFVFFETKELPFPVTGMSDVMPYNSSLFKELKGKRLTAYKAAFTRVLRETAERFQPDVIHTNHLFVLSALVRELFPEMPVVSTCHGTDLRQYNNCPHLRAYVKEHCRRLDRIIALSDDQKKELQQVYGVSSDMIVVIGGGYEGALFTRVPKKPAGTVHLLYAGKLNRSKGVPWLLKSLTKIEPLDWHLHLAGSGVGPEFDQCMRLVKKLGHKVTVHGYVSHRRLSELMKKAHVQVLPSFFEGLPLVLFEGLASGCRIITTQLSGFDEFFGSAKKESIDLIALPPLETIDRPFAKDEPDLENALCESLVKMIACVKKSPDLEDTQAEKIAADHTWSKVFERISCVYKELSQRPGH
jgi:glycosyltransferase involved in cell wall biosynthesis